MSYQGGINRIMVNIEFCGQKFKKSSFTFVVEYQVASSQLSCPGAGRNFTTAADQAGSNFFPKYNQITLCEFRMKSVFQLFRISDRPYFLY